MNALSIIAKVLSAVVLAGRVRGLSAIGRHYERAGSWVDLSVPVNRLPCRKSQLLQQCARIGFTPPVMPAAL